MIRPCTSSFNPAFCGTSVTQKRKEGSDIVSTPYGWERDYPNIDAPRPVKQSSRERLARFVVGEDHLGTSERITCTSDDWSLVSVLVKNFPIQKGLVSCRPMIRWPCSSQPILSPIRPSVRRNHSVRVRITKSTFNAHLGHKKNFSLSFRAPWRQATESRTGRVIWGTPCSLHPHPPHLTGPFGAGMILRGMVIKLE